ncbi:unnamed protein product [Arabidopsis halleri]
MAFRLRTLEGLLGSLLAALPSSRSLRLRLNSEGVRWEALFRLVVSCRFLILEGYRRFWSQGVRLSHRPLNPLQFRIHRTGLKVLCFGGLKVFGSGTEGFGPSATYFLVRICRRRAGVSES